MAMWTATIEIRLEDDGAMELYALTGMTPPDGPPYATVTVKVDGDSPREAYRDALEKAADLLASQ